MSPTIQYLDCCLPDYFRGYAGNTLAIPVTNKTTLKELRDELINDLNSIMWGDDCTLESKHIHHWYNNEIDAGNSPDTIVFPSLEDEPEEDSDMYQGCYAYFGIVEDEDE